MIFNESFKSDHRTAIVIVGMLAQLGVLAMVIHLGWLFGIALTLLLLFLLNKAVLELLSRPTE